MCIWILWFLRCRCLLLPSPAWPRPAYHDSWTLHSKLLCNTVFELLFSILLFLFKEHSLVFLVWQAFWPYRILWLCSLGSVSMFPLLWKDSFAWYRVLINWSFFFFLQHFEYIILHGFWWEISHWSFYFYFCWNIVNISTSLVCLIMSNFLQPHGQVSLTMEFFRQEYWSGLLFSTPRDPFYPGIKPTSLCLLHWQAGSSSLVPPGKPNILISDLQRNRSVFICIAN